MIVVKVISHPCPRITVMNTTYARGGARDLLLEYVSWSMNCLSFLIPRFMGLRLKQFQKSIGACQLGGYRPNRQTFGGCILFFTFFHIIPSEVMVATRAMIPSVASLMNDITQNSGKLLELKSFRASRPS